MLNNLFGGELLARMDRISSIAAKRHAESYQVVTASVNHVSFNTPVPLGSILNLKAKVTRAFKVLWKFMSMYGLMIQSVMN